MHVLSPPSPRLPGVSVAAAILAIGISLALASGLSNIRQFADGTSMSAHRTDGRAAPIAPGWASNPFASMLQPFAAATVADRSR